jgi:hypothetical protein
MKLFCKVSSRRNEDATAGFAGSIERTLKGCRIVCFAVACRTKFVGIEQFLVSGRGLRGESCGAKQERSSADHCAPAQFAAIEKVLILVSHDWSPSGAAASLALNWSSL